MRRNSLVDRNSILNDAILVCKIQIETLSTRVQENKEQVDDETIQKWKNHIMKLATEIERLSDKQKTSAKIAQEIIVSTLNDKLNDAKANPMEKAILDYRSNLMNVMAGIKVDNKREFIKKISNTFGRGDDGDEEIVFVNAGNKMETNCPYSRAPFVDPMKNSDCIHHISRESLTHMLNGKNSVKCPVPGCIAFWTKTSSNLDREFQMRLTRYLSTQASNTQNNSQSQSNVQTIDDDDDNGYTQV
eukprot:gene15866-21510_t